MRNLHIWFGIILSFIAVQLTIGPAGPVAGQNRFLAPPPEHIEYFHFGFSESMADSFWLRWIQDSDTCQTYLKPMEMLEPMPIPKGDRLYNPRHKICDNSWAFKMLDAVTKLAPRFYMPYVAGGISLSVLTEDYAGASVIFDRGIKQFPNDWPLIYRAAYHFLFDVQNKEKAAELFLQAAKNGAPEWLNLMSSRLFSETGKVDLGLAVLEDYRKGLTDPAAQAKVQKRINELKQKH